MADDLQGMSYVPLWNEESATLDAYEERVKLFISSTKKTERYLCGPRLLSRFDPESDTFKHVRANISNEQLEKEDGEGALLVVKIIRASTGPKSMQEAVRLLLEFFRLDGLRRQYGESMKKWTRRFGLAYNKVGTALNQANNEIKTDFLHEMIRGILLAETSGLSPSEFAAVLATSGQTGHEG